MSRATFLIDMRAYAAESHWPELARLADQLEARKPMEFPSAARRLGSRADELAGRLRQLRRETSDTELELEAVLLALTAIDRLPPS